jgi:hypothetical protein
MKESTVYWIVIAFAGVSLVPKTMVLVHTISGNQSKWVLTVTGLLTLYSVMTIALFSFDIRWNKGHTTMANNTWYCVIESIGNIAFNVSHAMLAEKYVSAKHRAVSTLELQ